MRVTLIKNLGDLLTSENPKNGMDIKDISFLPDWYRVKVNIGAGSICYGASQKSNEIQATLRAIERTGVEIKVVYLCQASPPHNSSKLVGEII